MTATYTDLLIAGAGVAGLAHAVWRRTEDADLDFLIVDRKSEPGGWIETRHIDGYVCESGPQGIRPTAVSDAFLAALGIEDAVVASDPLAKLRFVARDGRLHPVPTGPGGLWRTDLLSLGGKLRLLLEPFRRRGRESEETLASFVRRRFGPQAVPLAEVVAGGIFGGDAHALEVAAAFPKLAELEREHGSVVRGMFALRKQKPETPGPKRPTLCTFSGGMGTFVSAMRQQMGDRLMLGHEVQKIAHRDDTWIVELSGAVTTEIHARELVLAIPARRAADLLVEIDAKVAANLRSIPFASIANVFLGFRDADAREKLRGFGFLMDRREESPVLGAIYCSSIFPHSAPDGQFLLRVMVGGALHPEAVNQAEELLIREAERCVRDYAGVSGPLAFGRVHTVREAIPQFVQGHGARLRELREQIRGLPRLRLIGNSYDEVSVVGQLRRPDRSRSD